MVFSGNIQNYSTPKASNTITLPIYKNLYQEPNKKNQFFPSKISRKTYKNSSEGHHHLKKKKNRNSRCFTKVRVATKSSIPTPVSKNYRRCFHTPRKASPVLSADKLLFLSVAHCCRRDDKYPHVQEKQPWNRWHSLENRSIDHLLLPESLLLQRRRSISVRCLWIRGFTPFHFEIDFCVMFPLLNEVGKQDVKLKK